MADISKLTRLLNGVVRTVDMSANTLVVSSIKIGAGQTLLTQTILDKLVLMQGLTDVNGKYSANNVTVTGSPTNYTAASQNVQAHLEGIDTALAEAGRDEFDDNIFRVIDEVDNTKKMAFDVGSISTSTTRTITMPDANVDLGEIVTNTTHSTGDGSDHQDVVDLVALSGVGANSVNLGAFTGATIEDNRTIKQALQDLETYSEASRSLIQSFEWQESAIDYIVDNTATAPGSPTTGDRYVLSHDGGVPDASWGGASAGDVVEWDGVAWIATSPTLGMFISVDDDQSSIYQWGGSAWSSKAFENTTASTGLTKVGNDIQIVDANINGVNVTSGGFSVNVDNITIERGVTTGNPLQIKDGAITNAKVNASAAIDESKLNLDFGTSALNDAIALKQDANASLDEAVTFFTSTDISAAEAETLTDGSNADTLHEHAKIVKNMVAGEAFAANTTFLVRMAVSGETAGRIYKADSDATTLNNFYVMGLVVIGVAANIGDTIQVKLLGEHVLGPSDTPFNAADIGKPVYLSATGGFTVIPPTTTNIAVYKVGIVQETSKILVGNMQIVGIN